MFRIKLNTWGEAIPIRSIDVYGSSRLKSFTAKDQSNRIYVFYSIDSRNIYELIVKPMIWTEVFGIVEKRRALYVKPQITSALHDISLVNDWLPVICCYFPFIGHVVILVRQLIS